MRIIDADRLNDAMYHEAFENDASYNERNPMAKWDSGLWIRYKMFENAIADAPTIEPKRGKWIDRSGGIEGAWNYCSVCGEQAIDLYDFCPNCGADMRNYSEIPNNCETCRFELYCPEMCEGCCKWDSHYEPKDEPQTKLCRECEEYAGDGMYCASNYLVYDFDTCKNKSQMERSE